jgi:phosphoglycolate phosphatase-like HAD superfamily hydrolase
MLREAANRYDIDLGTSIMIGDKLDDIGAGISAGCRAILIRTGYGADHEKLVSVSTEVYDDILEAVKSLK